MTKQTLPTSTDAQLANRDAAFAAIDTAERHIALGATSPRHLERMADAILEADGAFAPQARVEAAAEAARQAKADKRVRCAIDHFAQAHRPMLTATTLRPNAAEVTALVEAILAPAPRRSVSRAERAEATRLADKLRVRTIKTTGRGAAPAKAALKAQQARVEAIAAGLAQVLPTAGFPNVCPPPRGRATLWTLCRTWDDPNAALRFHTAG